MLVKLVNMIENTCTRVHVFIDRAIFGGQNRAYLMLPYFSFDGIDQSQHSFHTRLSRQVNLQNTGKKLASINAKQERSIASCTIYAYNKKRYSGLLSPKSAFSCSVKFKSVGILSRFRFVLIQDQPYSTVATIAKIVKAMQML
jgi:hypothetical protein